MTTAHRARPGATVMVYCQHSTGLGHLVRTLAIATEIGRRGRVVVCSGGRWPEEMPVPSDFEVVALTPIGTGPAGQLTTFDPAVDLEQAFRARGAQLAACFDRVRPDAVVIELFPFGRRKFASEILGLLQQARRGPRPVAVICSVRDLLVTGHPDKQRHDDEAAARLEAWFDAVVVHGDPRFARLEETFRPTRSTGVPVHYSGFVTAGSRRGGRRSGSRPTEVLVSAGGGAVGGPLLRAAAHAHAAHFADRGIRTRIVTGPFLPAGEVAGLRAMARAVTGLTVEGFVPDLVEALESATVSVSQCGYNTSLDLLQSGTPAVVVPYGDVGEDEQADRARRLERLGVVDVIAPAVLDHGILARRVERLLAGHRRPACPVALDGASRTADLVMAMLRGRPGANR